MITIELTTLIICSVFLITIICWLVSFFIIRKSFRKLETDIVQANEKFSKTKKMNNLFFKSKSKRFIETYNFLKNEITKFKQKQTYLLGLSAQEPEIARKKMLDTFSQFDKIILNQAKSEDAEKIIQSNYQKYLSIIQELKTINNETNSTYEKLVQKLNKEKKRIGSFNTQELTNLLENAENYIVKKEKEILIAFEKVSITFENAIKNKDFNMACIARDNIKILIESEKTVLNEKLAFLQHAKEQIIKGLNPESEIYSVNYNFDKSSPNQLSNFYPYVMFPQYGTTILPYRRKQIARRGKKEEEFEKNIKNAFKDLLVLGDTMLLTADGARPYEPDIAIIDNKSGFHLRIDIEIDEPYDAINRIPTHFTESNDYYRDIYLTNLGWVVIRFTEKQVHTKNVNCLAFIANVIKSINPNFQIPDSLLGVSNIELEKKWTILEAQTMAQGNEREHYLNTTFGFMPQEDYSPVDRLLTDIEKNALNSFNSVGIRSDIYKGVCSDIKNIDKTKIICNDKEHINNAPIFLRSKELIFDKENHIYTYKGLVLESVSSLINRYFEVFNSEFWSRKKSMEWGVVQDQILEEWDCKGKESANVGTFLHTQIENFFNGNGFKTNYNFRYEGDYIKVNELIDISREKKFFLDFINEHNPQHIKTEFSVFDECAGIAGTIDCLCKVDENYIIYDWKRTRKIIDEDTYNIITNNWGKFGYGCLSSVPDLYVEKQYLQQNFYKYILEKRYNIKVSDMYLVVIRSNYDRYFCLKVPNRQNQIEKIINEINV